MYSVRHVPLVPNHNLSVSKNSPNLWCYEHWTRQCTLGRIHLGVLRMDQMDEYSVVQLFRMFTATYDQGEARRLMSQSRYHLFYFRLTVQVIVWRDCCNINIC